MKHILQMTGAGLLLLTGCTDEIPEPESVTAKEYASFASTNVQGVLATEASNEWQVSHIVQGKEVWIDCQLPQYTFVENDTEKPLITLLVYVDGKLVKRAFAPAFQLENLGKGSHSIQLVVIGEGEKRLEPSQQFWVNIP
ncbi:hypothetical protein [Bacillus fonticola]|uniref:hypothetical protein n=1 Tax=Bacillus fonticola TaxID=2728853 RepID=UPI001474DCDD|nr:hypothetical protein [Bacillus fonticola]